MNETRNEAGKITEGLPGDLIASIIAKRVQVGAGTPIGRRLSMVVQQMENGISPAATLREIEQINRDGGSYIHANHGKGTV